MPISLLCFAGRRCGLFIGLALLAVCNVTSIAMAEETRTAPVIEPYSLKIGIIPQQSAKKIYKLWHPLVEYLAEQTGYRFQILASPDIPTHEKRSFSGQYDILYTNPRLYVLANKEVGYQAIARETDKLLSGILVVKKNSKFTKLHDLENATIVFPVNAFAASTITSLTLAQQQIPYKHVSVETHDHAYAMVARGQFAAAGGVPRTFQKTNPQIRKQLRILWQSEGTSPHAFAVHPRMDKTVVERIQQSLVRLHESEEGRKILTNLGFNPLRAASDADWGDIKKLVFPH